MVNIGREAGNFFQSDRELAKQQLKEQKYNYTVGNAIKLSTKGLDVLVEGHYAYVAESGFLAKRIHLETQKTVKLFKGHKGPVTCMALTHNGAYLWTGSWDKTIKKWNTATAECLLTLQGHDDFIKCIAVSDTFLYSGSSDKCIFKWNITADEPTCQAVMKEHTRPIEGLAFAEDGGYLFSASTDLTIKKWDLAKDICVQTFSGHETSIYSIKVHEDELWTASADKTVRRWNTETGAVDTVLTHPDRVKSLAVVGGYVITGASDDIVRVWNIATGALECAIEGHFDEVSALAVQGSTVYSVSLDCSLRRWSITPEAMQKYSQAKPFEKKNPTSSGLTAEEELELDELLEDD
ncbi:WD40-repeat-containing domain protein [Spinellus fusiger]|nr:WD40-repeat-containing domain protein [Spinellus fusiger]